MELLIFCFNSFAKLQAAGAITIFNFFVNIATKFFSIFFQIFFKIFYWDAHLPWNETSSWLNSSVFFVSSSSSSFIFSWSRVAPSVLSLHSFSLVLFRDPWTTEIFLVWSDNFCPVRDYQFFCLGPVQPSISNFFGSGLGDPWSFDEAWYCCTRLIHFLRSLCLLL